jgi:glutaredoxin
LLETHEVDYEWHDIDEEPEHVDTVVRYAGKRKVPVIVFDDGTCLIEPADEELATKLGL